MTKDDGPLEGSVENSVLMAWALALTIRWRVIFCWLQQ